MAFLFDLASITAPLDTLLVKSMDDGQMGSLAVAPYDQSRRYGSTCSECHFYDEDGTLVSAALNLDQTGTPFEIDVWKVDFSPLIRWPTIHELKAGAFNFASVDVN